MPDYIKKEPDDVNMGIPPMSGHGLETAPEIKKPDVLATPQEAAEAQAFSQRNAYMQSQLTPGNGGGENDGSDYSERMKSQGMYSFLKNFYDDEKTRLAREEQRARRERSKALIGDLAKVGGQMFAAGRGARQFQPVKSGLTAADERMEKIREAGTALDRDFRNKSLTLQMQEDAEKKAREQKAADREQALQDEARKFDQQKELAEIAAGNKKEQAELAQQYKLELEAEKHKNRLSEIRLRGGVKKSDSGEYEAADENGQIHSFKKKDAAIWYAKQHGTWKAEDDVTEKQSSGTMGSTKSRTTKPGGYPSTGRTAKPQGTKKTHKDNPY